MYSMRFDMRAPDFGASPRVGSRPCNPFVRGWRDGPARHVKAPPSVSYDPTSNVRIRRRALWLSFLLGHIESDAGFNLAMYVTPNNFRGTVRANERLRVEIRALANHG